MDQKRANKIDLTIVWDDAKAMGRANRDLLTAIAGMFLLLPVIVGAQFMMFPAKLGKDPTPEAIIAWYSAYFSANLPLLFGVMIVSSFGSLALLTLLLRTERLTVGESLRAALLILPGYVIANFISSFAFMIGGLLFLLPCLYLIGRLSLIAAVAAGEKLTNPIAILRRSVELTSGNGWRIFGLIAVIFVVMVIINSVVTILLGVFTALLLPTDLAGFVMDVASGIVTAAFATVMALVSAALYRSATAPVFTPWNP